MLKKICSLLFISQLIHTAPGDPVTLKITPQRVQRNAERMLDTLRAYANATAETIIRNGDEELFEADRRGNFGKSLHRDDAIFHKTEYDKLLSALESQNSKEFDALTGGAPGDQSYKLVNPQAMYAFDFQGADQWNFSIPAAPTVRSAEAAGEMVEVYWHALLRDVPFNKYGLTDSPTLVQERAIAGINALTNFKGPKNTGNVTAQTLFRGTWPGELTGPYISQFLYLPVLLGPGINFNGSGTSAPFDTPAYQEYATPQQGASNNFMTDEAEWKTIQKGGTPTGSITFDQTRRWFIRNGRDLGEYVHNDTPTQVGINTALILLTFGGEALDDNMFYLGNANQDGFVTFAITSVLSQVAKVVELALKAAWFQKWYVHRRLRPEVFGYLIEHEGTLNTGLHSDIMTASLWAEPEFTTNKLLPMAYPEGSPCHPAYPAGHATQAGAVATVLKAFFKEDFVISDAVQPNSTNDDLEAYTGADLTIGHELNKLASNISIGRNIAGVHYRSDGTEGMLLGEKVAIKFLEDLGATYHEGFAGFSLTKFDGTTITGLGAKK